MIGAAVILADPIFQGLAISLLFGLASSTLLTVLVIPAIYMVLRYRAPEERNEVPAI
jgi:multidrug efflux pump subunit AcrB